MEAGKRKGRPPPQWYLDEPPILPGHQFYLLAFYRLSTCRQLGMGRGPIPWNRIVEYGSNAGLNDGIIDHFASVIQAMDAEYLRWHDREDEKARKRKE